MKLKKWKIVLWLGLLPFLWALGSSVYAAVSGFFGAKGLEAFCDYLILYSFVYWPTYLVGGILIVWGGWHLLEPKQ